MPTIAPTASPTPTGLTASATPTPTDNTTGNEQISMTILKDVAAPTVNLDMVVSEGSASLTTDKPDYAPTDTALITGSNLLPNTIYALTISSSDNPPTSTTITVTSDDKGVFAYAYQLDGNYRPNYQAQLLDAAGTVVASTTFTDNYTFNIKINNNAPTTPSANVTLNMSWNKILLDPMRAHYANVNSSASCPNTLSSAWSSWEPIVNLGGNTATKPWTLTAGANGSRKVCAETADYVLLGIPFGVITTSDTIDLEIDTTPPALTLPLDITQEAVSSTGNVVTYTVTANDAVDGVIPVSCNHSSGSTFPLGATTVSCSASDKAGNTATGSFKVIIKDTTAPSVPALVSPTDGVYRHTSDSNKSDWTDVADISTPVVYYYESSLLTATNSDGSFASTAYKSGALTVSEIMNPGEPPVTYYWHVEACDAVGNCSHWSPAWQIHIDNMNPTIPILTSPNNNGYLTTHNFTFQWNPSVDSSPLTYEWESSYQNVTNTNGFFVNQLADHTNLGTSVDSPGTPDNTYYWHVRAVDAAGNTSAWSDVWKITIDTTAPTVPTNVSPTDGSFRTTATQTFIDWTTETDPNGPVTYFYQSSNSNNLNPDGSFIAPVYSSGVLSASQILTPGTPAGIYFWHVRSQDALGNKSAWSTPWKVTVDNTAPIITILPYSNTWTNQDIIVSATANEGVLNASSHTFSANSSFDFIATDEAGNVTTRTVTITNIDKTAPTTPLANPPADNYDSDQLVTLSSSDLGSGLVSIFYTTDNSNPRTSGTKISYPLDNSALITVNHDMTVKAIAYDNAGNVSDMLSATYGVPPHISGETFTRTNDGSLRITWTTDDPSTSRVVYGTSPVSDATVATYPEGSNYGYQLSTLIQDESPNEVTFHSVAIDGVNVNQTYYYRVISHGSPEAVGKENPFATYYIFGLPGDGLGCATQDCNNNANNSGASAGSAVLGATTLAYAGGTGGEVLGTGVQPEVLGAATGSATPTPSVTKAPASQALGLSTTNWAFGYFPIALLILIILVIIAYFIYRKKRK